MTRDDIIRMFHEAGEAAGWKPGVGNALVINYLTHFYALAAAAEREACATIDVTPLNILASDGPGTAILKYRAAIRARGQS